MDLIVFGACAIVTFPIACFLLAHWITSKAECERWMILGAGTFALIGVAFAVIFVFCNQSEIYSLPDTYLFTSIIWLLCFVACVCSVGAVIGSVIDYHLAVQNRKHHAAEPDEKSTMSDNPYEPPRMTRLE